MLETLAQQADAPSKTLGCAPSSDTEDEAGSFASGLTGVLRRAT